MNFTAFFNFFEAALWVTISAVLLCRWLASKTSKHFTLGLPLAFFVFGISDLIESQTGAWWQPWWLLVMKTACVLVFFACWLKYRRAKLAAKQSDSQNVPSEKPPSQL